MRFTFTRSTFSSGGGCFFAFTPSKKFLTSSRAISAFSSGVLSYGNFSGVFREGPNLYCLPLLDVTERLQLSSFLVYEEEDYDAPEQPERRRISSALADEAEKEEAGCSGAPAQAEKEAECRHTPEKEPAEGPDHHSPEEEAVEEAECPDSPEEEEEAEASSSEG